MRAWVVGVQRGCLLVGVGHNLVCFLLFVRMQNNVGLVAHWYCWLRKRRLASAAPPSIQRTCCAPVPYVAPCLTIRCLRPRTAWRK